MKILMESIEKLGRKIASGGGSDVVEVEDTDLAVAAMLAGSDSETVVESNVDKVEVREDKASGVSSVLDKLKSLKGG